MSVQVQNPRVTDHYSQNPTQSLQQTSMPLNEVRETQDGAIQFIVTKISEVLDKALHYFALAADKLFFRAHYKMGLIWKHRGDGKISHENAFDHFKFAAKEGHAEAQYEVAKYLLTGEGGFQSDEGTIEYYKLASDQGHEQSRLELLEEFNIPFSSKKK